MLYSQEDKQNLRKQLIRAHRPDGGDLSGALCLRPGHHVYQQATVAVLAAFRRGHGGRRALLRGFACRPSSPTPSTFGKSPPA